MDDQAELLAKLHADTRIPPIEFVGKLQKKYTDRNGVDRVLELDYLGHAAVTDILLAHDPEWSWEPAAVDELGRPAVDRDKDGWPRGLWIRLTVYGHTRLGYGTCGPGKPDAVKELIGDALRNAAMRFGVGLSLWAKEEWNEEGVEAGGTGSQAGTRTQKQPRGSAKENVSRSGKVSQIRRATDDDVARHPANGPVLRADQAIAALATKLDLDEQTYRDVIRAVTGGEAESGKDLNAEQVTKVMRNLRWLADGFVELEYDPKGVPTLVDSHPQNPGPTSPGQRVDG